MHPLATPMYVRTKTWSSFLAHALRKAQPPCSVGPAVTRWSAVRERRSLAGRVVASIGGTGLGIRGWRGTRMSRPPPRWHQLTDVGSEMTWNERTCHKPTALPCLHQWNTTRPSHFSSYRRQYKKRRWISFQSAQIRGGPKMAQFFWYALT